ncbi:MAG: hypothetical protein JSU94_00190 [Phycisphaerales bacterium]|nr:MAG: hypothetical protein JSU94_00190 [Phycisphaerales bacterium]
MKDTQKNPATTIKMAPGTAGRALAAGIAEIVDSGADVGGLKSSAPMPARQRLEFSPGPHNCGSDSL